MAVMKVDAAGISTISGAMKRPVKKDGHTHGNYLVAVHRKAPSENADCQRVYSFDNDRYKRTGMPTAKEQKQRARFAFVANKVRLRSKDLSQISDDQAAFIAQKDAPNGKKTMKAYLWSLELATYDAEHAND